MTTAPKNRVASPATDCAAHAGLAFHPPAALETAPGVLLAGAIAVSAFLAHAVPGMTAFSPMILAIVLGMAFHNFIGTPAIAKPGINFSLRRLLRIAIVLLGFQLTVGQVLDVGGRGLIIVAASLTATFLFTVWLGRLLKLDRKLTQLIAAGTSICGASAIIATNTVAEAHDEDVAYAVACVTVFGSVAMFTYPLLPRLLHLDPHAYGLWSGASIHEIAQVVAASFQNGQRAGEFGTIVKLARVMLLAPVVFALSIMQRLAAGRSAAGTARPPLPWFVLGFIGVVALNSAMRIPPEVSKEIALVTTFLLSVALAAMGLETDVSKIRAKGLRPALLGAISFLFIASVSLALIKLV
ncbi:YeiH family protein [Bradyrhizobium sp. ARR65]|uniref:YeiH family protein n=1 Tax=Bradyrhizobium sp. ARR65 TaxID=1040989 RepID=UPI00046653A1|nr:YeiH family protein [Bradyrhizobium sp. ARR65]